ncbi:MAG: hypothetical protein ACLFUJ_11570 [Phycisphaerae bacterium]
MNNAQLPPAHQEQPRQSQGGSTVADSILRQSVSGLETDQAQLADMLRRSNHLRYQIVRQIRKTLETLRSGSR